MDSANPNGGVTANPNGGVDQGGGNPGPGHYRNNWPTGAPMDRH